MLSIRMFCTVIFWLSHCNFFISDPLVCPLQWLADSIAFWKFVWLISLAKKTVSIKFFHEASIVITPYPNTRFEDVVMSDEFNIICLRISCYGIFHWRLGLHLIDKLKQGKIEWCQYLSRIRSANMDLPEGMSWWMPRRPSELIQ